MTHRLCTHRLHTSKMAVNASGHPHPIWPAIRRVREDQRITEEEAAERCGLHRTYYSGVERAVRNVSLVNVERISKGLRVSMSHLFSRL